MRTAILLAGLVILPWTPAAAQGLPTVTVERVAAGRWRATYRLASPAASLRFERPAGYFREQAWTPVTPGYRIVRDAEAQVVRLDSGAVARAEVAFEFGEYTAPIQKEYEFFQPFSDGAVALYTGHLYVVPGGRDSTPLRLVRIVPPAGAHGLLRGRIVADTVSLADSTGEGTFVYLGTTRPIEEPDLLAVVDPGMPGWLADIFSRQLPGLFAGYAARFGASPPWKPMVLYSYHPEGADRSSGGGVLPGVINMTLTGKAWAEPDAGAAEQVIHLLAHEAAHIWNAQLVEAGGGPSEDWIHEGGADALAAAMLLDLGVIDTARHRALLEEALNRCSAAAPGGPVGTAISRGAVRQVYDCGVVMALWTGAAMRLARPGADYFAFWRELVRAAQAGGGRYDAALYFATLRSAGVADSVVDAMRAFPSSGEGMALAVTGLGAAGVDVRTGQGTPPVPLQSELAREALFHLMRQACGKVNFGWGAPVRTGAIKDCRPFERELLVSRIAGFRTEDEGARIHDAVAAACAAGRAVALQAEDGARLTSVPCDRPLAARAPWYELRDAAALVPAGAAGH